jgi:hypothetical protein
LKEFLGVVNHSLTWWNHLQTSPELTPINDRFCAAKVEVAQQKSSLSSLPLGKRPTVMATFASKTREIVVVWDEQQRISKLITTTTDKALMFYTKLIDV